MIGLVVGVVVLILVGIAIWLGWKVPHPEESTGDEEPGPDDPSHRFYRGTHAPAGPDAEDPILPNIEPPDG